MESTSKLGYKSLDDYIAESTSYNYDGEYIEIKPIVAAIKKIYIDLTNKTTIESYSYIQLYNEQETKRIDFSSVLNMLLNQVKFSIISLVDNNSFTWLYYNSNNRNEVIIDIEDFFGGYGHIKKWVFTRMT